MLQTSKWMRQHGFLSLASVIVRHSAPSNLRPNSMVASFRNFLARFSSALPFQLHASRRFLEMMIPARSHFSGSDMPDKQSNLFSGKELFDIIKSACYELNGQSHCWLNIVCEVNKLLNKEEIFLILVNAYIATTPSVDNCDRILMIEGVKFLQKRYPNLQVIGLQCVGSVKSVSVHSEVLKTIMEEYITFPVLVVDRKMIKVTDSAVCLFSEGSTSCNLSIETASELGSLYKVVDELNLLKKDNLSETAKGDKLNQDKSTEQNYGGASFRNLLLCYAESLSVDEDEGRIFLSDSNHHRIIITDGDGKVLDSIGSSPGFVDADFDLAKLGRPATSFYNVSDGCLYFVDSENNAIRRADLSSRLVETVYPTLKPSGFWGLILVAWNKILNISGLGIDGIKPEDHVFNQLTSPWHLLKLGDDEVIIVSHSCAVAWILNTATWKVKEVIRGHQNILGNYGNLMAEKLSFLKDAYDVLQQKLSKLNLMEKNPFILMSSFMRFQNDIIFLDTDSQNVLKFSRASKTVSCIPFSNVGVLGLPYWLSCPIERVFNSGNYVGETIEHVQNFSVLPGRVYIKVNVDIPKDTRLAAPLDANCFWCQANGSAAVVSKIKDDNISLTKVGIAQQWFDELDNLAFSNAEPEDAESSVEPDDESIEKGFKEMEKPKLSCAVNVSPGTSEVIVSAGVYLKLNPTVSLEDATSMLSSRELANDMEAKRIRMFLENCKDMSCIIFTKPLHLRIKLECEDHPTAVSSKETIMTDTQLEMNVIIK